MSVSAGVGGTTVVGALLSSGAVGHSDATPASVVRTLPFTGAGDVMVLVALALVLLIAGGLALGLARQRRTDGDSP
jgi:hypothetical protein